jgi:ATP-dependent Clp protease adaptor protein ClpS
LPILLLPRAKVGGLSTIDCVPAERESVLTESRTREKVTPPKLWRVLLHNDDYTTQDFVVLVLESIFHKPRAEAFAIMMHVHLSGLGLAGIYTRDVAETKVTATKRLAEQHEFPLLVTMEPEPEEQRA